MCWAHLLRDFRRIAERSGAAGEVGRRLLGLGYVMFRRRHRLSEADVPSCRTDLAGVRVRVRQALERGAALLVCPRTAATCANLLKIEPALWTFTTHAEVPPTNNSAEQALRPVVLKRKISGPTRSRRGANFIARGFSVAETCRRQGRDLLDYLQRSVCAWIDKTEAPALLRPAIASG
ncbi:IS66 family transposase [Pseudaquabacterium rugosum]|uniref:Transposase n=1 Tax=Pseudaquabacterium rugosum TaxID=2984194 RepID=A0ABU9BDL7_9BURK